MKFDHYETTRGAEHIEDIKLFHSPYRYSTLYMLKVPELEADDIVTAHSQFEVTNDLGKEYGDPGFNVMVAHAMMIHSERVIVSHDDTFPPGDFMMPCAPAGENVTPGMHHGFRTLVGSHRITNDGDAWISVVIYAASSKAKDGDSIRVMKRYGGLSATVMRTKA